MNIEIPYTPQPRQVKAHLAKAKELLYGGSAGGGKSAFLRWDLVDFCANLPSLLAVLFRRNTKQLKRNHIDKLIDELPLELATWHATDGEFRFFNGSKLVCMHMEHPNDVENIQGWEIHIAGIDEGGQFTAEMLAYIRSRMRLGNYSVKIEKMLKDNPRLSYYIDRLPRVCIASNPGGLGHHYLKQNFIDPAPAETEFVDDEGISKIFIPASMKDNQYLDDNYAIQFSEMPEWQRRQLVDGDWDTIPGAFFDCFHKSRHVVRAFSIPRHWTRFRSFDWGHATPFSVGWWCVADDTVVRARDGTEYQFPEGAIIRYREWYGAKEGKRGPVNQGLRMDAADVGQQILKREFGEHINYGVADPACWRSDGAPSVAEKMANGGVIWQKAANDRAAGSQLAYSRLKKGYCYVMEHCVEFIRTVPALETDDKKPEEYVKQGEDHIGDEFRYACASRPKIEKWRPPVYHAHLPTLDEVLAWRRPQQTAQWL